MAPVKPNAVFVRSRTFGNEIRRRVAHLSNRSRQGSPGEATVPVTGFVFVLLFCQCNWLGRLRGLLQVRDSIYQKGAF